MIGEDELERALWAANMTTAHVERRTPAGLVVRGRPALEIPPDLQPIVVGKWTRGSYYFVNKQPLPTFVPWAWSSPTAASDPRALIQRCQRSMPIVFECAEFRVWGTATREDPASSIWMFAIWNKLVFFGTTGSLATTDASEALLRAMSSPGRIGSPNR